MAIGCLGYTEFGFVIEESLGITNPDYYYYLNQSGCVTVDGTDDVKEFQDTIVSFFFFFC